jgi:transposase
MGDGLTLSSKDERRAVVLGQVGAGLLSISEAAALIGVSERQARRLLAAYQTSGPRGIVHGNRGRVPAHATTTETRSRVVALATTRYEGVNHAHLAELLAEREGLHLSRPTVQRILAREGVRSPKPQRRRSTHRSRRDRYPQEGMLLQIDASHHHWFGAAVPRLALLAVIDDATGIVPAALFQPTEDAFGYLSLLRRVVLKAGVPGALYSDRHSIFWPTNGQSLAEQLAGRRSPTQFGRAMAELGIQLVAAHSPQAKGRVERLWGTLQDRLVSELRLAGITTLEEANAFLPAFLARFNKRFAVPAETPGRAYRPPITAAEADAALCFKHDRVVQNDNIVRLDGMIFQILPGPNRLGYAKATVTIRESLDARYSIFYKGKYLPAKLKPARLLVVPHAIKPLGALTPIEAPTPQPPPKPDLGHPWRKYPAVTKSLNTYRT